MAEVIRSYQINVLDTGDLVWREIVDGEPIVPRDLAHVANMFRQGAEYFRNMKLANAIAQALRPPQVMQLPQDGGPRLHI